MSNYRRSQQPGAAYFFTVVTHDRRAFLTDPDARDILKAAYTHIQSRKPFETIALCLLPNHIHCIWRMPENDSNYSGRWSQIKSLFTRRYMAGGGLETAQSDSRLNYGYRGIWQRRFWEHRIRDREDLANHIHYIHYNPVRHGYVDDPDEWRWSTYHRYCKDGRCDNIDWNAVSDGHYDDGIEYEG